jgi:peptidyl-prolyl cis-trans isomerase B (cyclophilin B)
MNKYFIKLLFLLLVPGCYAKTEVPVVEVQKELPIVEMQTSQGTIVIALDEEKAPKTVANFLAYVKSGFYDGTIFHRVISNFMIQGGGYTPDFEEKKTGKPIRNEANNGLSNVRGTIAMARTSNPHSATAQFFINVVDNSFLDHTQPTMSGWGYAVFGKVIKGMEVVDKIKQVPTGNKKGHQNVPKTAVIIQKVLVVEDKINK